MPGLGKTQSVVAQLKYDGTTFWVVPGKSCLRGLGSIPAYVAPANGPLLLNGNVSMQPICVPQHPHTNRLFLVAIPRRGHMDMMGGGPYNGMPIAGAADMAASTWVFKPMSPGLTMTSGMKYNFVIATMSQGNH